MVSATIGPYWNDRERQEAPQQLRQLISTLRAEGTLSEKEIKQQARESPLFAIVLADSNGAKEVDQIRGELADPKKAGALTVTQKLDALDRAKAIATNLPFENWFEGVIDDQTALLLSPETHDLPSEQRKERSTVLMVELSARFADNERRANRSEARFSDFVAENQFSHAYIFLENLEFLSALNASVRNSIGALARQAGITLPVQDEEGRTIVAQPPRQRRNTGLMFDSMIAQANAMAGSKAPELSADKRLEETIRIAWEVGELKRKSEQNIEHRQSPEGVRQAKSLDRTIDGLIAAVADAFKHPDIGDPEWPVRNAAHLFHIPGVTEETKTTLQAGMKVAIDRELAKDPIMGGYSTLAQIRLNLGMGDIREEWRRAYIAQNPERARELGLT